MGLVRNGPQGGPNWTEKWSELDCLVVRTGPQNKQNGGGPNWTAIFMFSKMAYLSRARAKEPVRTTKSGPNWTASEELGNLEKGCAGTQTTFKKENDFPFYKFMLSKLNNRATMEGRFKSRDSHIRNEVDKKSKFFQH